MVKSSIWAISLGSGTSGGVLAPLLMMGAALGGMEAMVFPHAGIGFWPLVSMGAILGGTMRSPLTGIIFAVELTHDMNMFLPLVVAVTSAHAFTVLTLRRSILTEKLDRRGFHIAREYAVDALEVLFVREVMNERPRVVPSQALLKEALDPIEEDGHVENSQHLYPMLDDDALLTGGVTRAKMLEWATDPTKLDRTLIDLAGKAPMTIFSSETLRTAVYRMAQEGVTQLIVVNPADENRVVGNVALHDLLKARTRHLEEEERRQRILPWEHVLPKWMRPPMSDRSASLRSPPRQKSGRVTTNDHGGP